MRDPVIDTLAKGIATASSRRQMLRVSFQLIVSTFAMSLTRRSHNSISVFAAEQCSSVGFDGTCGGGFQKRTKQPPELVEINGCGAKGGKKFPNSFMDAQLEPGCDNHDRCYSNCTTGKSKCDSDFFFDLSKACINALPNISLYFDICLTIASGYTIAVTVGGGDAYRKAQQKHCECCRECAADEEPCGILCCDQSSCQVCSQGGCVSACEGSCLTCVNGTCASCSSQGLACCNGACQPIDAPCCTPGQAACGDGCCPEGSYCCDKPGFVRCEPIGTACCGLADGSNQDTDIPCGDTCCKRFSPGAQTCCNNVCVPIGTEQNCFGTCAPCPEGSSCCSDGVTFSQCCQSDQRCDSQRGCVNM